MQEANDSNASIELDSGLNCSRIQTERRLVEVYSVHGRYLQVSRQISRCMTTTGFRSARATRHCCSDCAGSSSSNSNKRQFRDLASARACARLADCKHRRFSFTIYSASAIPWYKTRTCARDGLFAITTMVRKFELSDD